MAAVIALTFIVTVVLAEPQITFPFKSDPQPQLDALKEESKKNLENGDPKEQAIAKRIIAYLGLIQAAKTEEERKERLKEYDKFMQSLRAQVRAGQIKTEPTEKPQSPAQAAPAPTEGLGNGLIIATLVIAAVITVVCIYLIIAVAKTKQEINDLKQKVESLDDWWTNVFAQRFKMDWVE